MERTSVRVRAWWDDLRDSLWVLPTVTVLVSFLTASGLVALQPHVPDRLDGFTFGGSPEGARAVLSELAGATFTVTGVVFSLTIVALQMASSQFTPRLLRTFLRDRRTQLVLSGMLGSGVFDVAVLRQVRSPGEGSESGFVPELAVSAALLYALVAVGLLVFFLHHLTRHMRVDVIMADIRRQTLDQLRAVERRREVLPDLHGPEPGPHSFAVQAKRGGYLQTVEIDMLARTASAHDVVVRLRPTMGDWVSSGTTLAWAWHDDDRPISLDRDELASAIHSALHLGPDRTESADLAFGLRQLADIAVRALSTGVNDPTTAVQALGQLAAVLVELSKHPLGADQAVGDDGVVRAVAPRADLAGHLELAIDQIRRYGRDEPAVLIGIAVLLTDLAEHVADDADRQEVVRDQLRRTRLAVEVDDPDASRRVTRALDEAERTLEFGARPPGQIEAG